MRQLLDKAETFIAGIHSKVDHLFQAIKCKFGYLKTRYQEPEKNAARWPPCLPSPIVDGAPRFHGSSGMRSPEMGQQDQNGAQIGQAGTRD
jgi:hypothetical protein